MASVNWGRSYSAADIFSSTGTGSFAEYARAESAGLLAGDNITSISFSRTKLYYAPEFNPLSLESWWILGNQIVDDFSRE